MRPLATFPVANAFPAELARLNDLCFNLYWIWNPVIRRFLQRISPELWHATNHSPLKMIRALRADHLENLAADPSFVEEYKTAVAELDAYVGAPSWYGSRGRSGETIAYFSAEFGLHESIPLYSGGLGVLSGDHIKAASDLALPMVGVGLMYQMGYFRQHLTLDGTQIENYEFNDPSVLPVTEVTDTSGKPLRISLDFPDGAVNIGVWKLNVGRIPIYLLDTNVAGNNNPKYRDIADYLYGGDQETRIMQEIVLGIGGLRALQAMGISPTVTHSNEGHSAFLMLERTRILMQELGMKFEEAAELTAAGSVFTTHTPVPAGHDVFPPEMVERYFGHYRTLLGLGHEQFMALGRAAPDDQSEGFSMTILAMKLTSRRNGVSQLHGWTSRRMWSRLWSNLPNDETPIIGITNGVHTPTWIADRMGELFSEYVAPDWRERIAEPGMWRNVDGIPDAKLLQVKNELRRKMIEYVRTRLEEKQAEVYTRTKAGRDRTAILDPEVLTIGFARRFATYKRATLLFRDPERVRRLFFDPERPIQLVIAGKAHPKDQPGKEFLHQIFQLIREMGLHGRVVFVEDYDMAVARHMIQGCDVWLNTPRRPLEASGTSGMKAAANATLNLSVLDGWYPEAYDGTNGFAIEDDHHYVDTEHQDEIESRQLYRLLEENVLPGFYNRNADGVPEQWIAMQKRSLATMVAQFSADRMVHDYAEHFYFPSAERYRDLSADHAASIRTLHAWKGRINRHWQSVSFADVHLPSLRRIQAGDVINVEAILNLGDLSESDIRVEAYFGGLDPDGNITDGVAVQLAPHGTPHQGKQLFRGPVRIERVGRTGMTIRALPRHPQLLNPAEMNLITWAGTGE